MTAGPRGTAINWRAQFHNDAEREMRMEALVLYRQSSMLKEVC